MGLAVRFKILRVGVPSCRTCGRAYDPAVVETMRKRSLVGLGCFFLVIFMGGVGMGVLNLQPLGLDSSFLPVILLAAVVVIATRKWVAAAARAAS